MTGRSSFVLTLLVACGSAPSAGPSPAAARTRNEAATVPPAADPESWGRFHSKRFQLSLPLPDGRAWKIDDRSRPELVAAHDPTASRILVLAHYESELVSRTRCEAIERERGRVPKELTTVEEEVVVGPGPFDSRVWVAVGTGVWGQRAGASEASGGTRLHGQTANADGSPKGALEGHVFLFGGHLRRCLFVHYTTRVPSADEPILSARLALARERIFRRIVVDPSRTQTDAPLPRERPEIRQP